MKSAAFFLAMLQPAGATALRGELCFPLEGWALISHWHLGSGALSVRQGYMLRNFKDSGWSRLSVGSELPASKYGTWLRNAFKHSTARWADAHLEAAGMPPGARIFINGRELPGNEPDSPVSLKSHLRNGVNSIVLAFPPFPAGGARVPAVSIKRIRGGTGRAEPPVKLRIWRIRHDRIDRLLADNWIASSDTAAWPIETARPPASGELWLPPGPVCLKAALDFPSYWAGRELAAYFHEIPGDPDVYINGRKMIDRLNCPARLDLKSSLKFNGRDSICLVFPELPRVPRLHDGEWGVVAIHWGPHPRLPLFASGTTLLYEAVKAAPGLGARRALDYASQVLAVSSSPFDLVWGGRERDEAGGASEMREASPGPSALLAVWPDAPYSREDLDPLGEQLEKRRDELVKSGIERIWLMSIPAVGARSESIPNSRLSVFRNRINDMAVSGNVRVIPVFDVFRSALRCQRRWPCAPVFADMGCRLTPHGSFLVGLAILDAFSLP